MIHKQCGIAVQARAETLRCMFNSQHNLLDHGAILSLKGSELLNEMN